MSTLIIPEETRLSPSVIERIFQNEWTRIWIPKEYHGLEVSLTEGLQMIEQLAQEDGSLGWVVTLTSGANYFSRNIKPEVAKRIFTNPRVCFAGSGMISGTAQKIGDKYILNGKWLWGTAAPYATHFSFNAQIVENGVPQVNSDGTPVFRSFFLDKNQVQSYDTWNAFGLIATATNQFEVRNIEVTDDNLFQYNKSYFDKSPLDRIPFAVMADITILANHVGIAKHYLNESLTIRKTYFHDDFTKFLDTKTADFYREVTQIEHLLHVNRELSPQFCQKIHDFGVKLVEDISMYIVKIHPLLGMRAAMLNEPINKIFRDFFTLTQHIHFRNTQHASAH
ncbi:MAG: hypothetical protein NZ455_13000 [Bacteroidia bacterium]|nr:hypothetical protein [Bacteroidia bacterium]MDW8346494.1 hypothetical protein [Bacteroidia bacterium]